MEKALDKSPQTRRKSSAKGSDLSVQPFHRPLGAGTAKASSPVDRGAGRPSYFSGKGLPVQADLKIGAPNDKYEQEADAMAEQVVSGSVQAMISSPPPIQRWDGKSAVQLAKGGPGGGEMPPPETEDDRIPKGKKDGLKELVFRKCADCEEKAGGKLQRKNGSGHPMTTPAGFSDRLQARSGSGFSLPSAIQAKMEEGFRRDFSNVSIHTDAEAADMSNNIGAYAFTHGKDIYFSKHQYSPHTKSGQRLLAHELTHVVQQGGSSRTVASKLVHRSKDAKPATPECKITTETVATTPADRTRKKIGVGEEVNLTVSEASATWAVSSGSGKLTPAAGSHKTVKFTAGDLKENVKITATAGSSTCEVEFEVVRPTNWIMKRQSGTNLRHKLNRPDVGWKGIMYFQPKDVYFYNIETREKDSKYVGTGSYSSYTGDYHGNYAGGASSWFPVTAYTADGSTDNVADTVYTGDPGAGVTGSAPPFVAGSGHFPITLQWKIGSGSVHDFGVTNQEDEIFTTGKCESRKGGNTESAMWNDATSTY